MDIYRRNDRKANTDVVVVYGRRFARGEIVERQNRNLRDRSDNYSNILKKNARGI